MKTRTAIFDLDGVVVDTARFHYLAWRRLALEKFNYEFTIQQNELFKGVNRIRCMEIMNDLVGAKLAPDKIKEYADIKNEWYKEYVSNMGPEDLLEGALSFIKCCKENGLYVCIASASKNTMLVLERTKIKNLFDVIVDGNCVTKAKPDPEVFLTAAFKVNSKPEECVVFEDSQAGIDAARTGHMKCIAIGSPEILKGADKYFPGLYALSINDIL